MKHVIYDWLGLNKAIFTSVNYITNLGALPYFFIIISKPFELVAFISYYIIILLYTLLKLKRGEYKYIQYLKIFNELIKIGSMYACIGLFYAFLKYTIDMPRPYCATTNFLSINNFEHTRCLSSFPSAQTAMAVFMYYVSFGYLNKTCKILGCLIIFLVGVSRISLAMHFPADIVYSLLIALLICKCVEKILQLKTIQTNILVPIANKIWHSVV